MQAFSLPANRFYFNSKTAEKDIQRKQKQNTIRRHAKITSSTTKTTKYCKNLHQIQWNIIKSNQQTNLLVNIYLLNNGNKYFLGSNLLQLRMCIENQICFREVLLYQKDSGLP